MATVDQPNDPLGPIVEALSEIIKGNFAHRLQVRDPHSVTDAIHAAINMTAEELGWQEVGRSETTSRIEHLNLILRAIRKVHQLVVTGESHENLIEIACSLLVATRGYTRVWIALTDAAGRPVRYAQAGWGEEFRALTDDLKQGKLPPCSETILSSPGVVYTLDHAAKCEPCRFREQSSDGVMAVGLGMAGTVYGMMCAAVPSSIRADKDERELLREVASDLTMALRGIERDRDRLQAVQALQQSNEQYQTLFESVGEGIVVADRKTLRFKLCNSAFCDMFGCTPEEAIGRPPADFLTAEGRTQLATDFRARNRAERILSLEVPCRRKDGSIVYADIRIASTIINDEECYVGFLADVTERIQAEEARAYTAVELQTSNEKYRTLFETAAEGILVVDRTTRKILHCNPAVCRLLGYAAQEVTSLTIDALHPVEAVEYLSRLLVDTAPKLAEGPVRVPSVRKDGTTIHVNLNAAPSTIDGRDCLIAFITDVTARVKAEEDLQRAHKNLQETTGQLVQTGKLTAIGELAAGVAHELNQPLNAIRLIAQFALKYQDRSTKDKWLDDLREILELVDKMAQLINELRTFARRSDQGVRIPVSLDALVDHSLKFHRSQLESREITLITDVSPTLPQVVGDPIRLEQVLLNLLSNAQDALAGCQRVDKALHVKAYQPPDAPTSVVIEVRDNGPGIPEDLKMKVFEPFFTTKEVGKGTGLGLSLARKILDEHGGRIGVESALGEGTAFRITLPIANQEQKADQG